MPTDAAGNFRMNAQIARSPIGGKKPAAAPAADPNTAPDDPNGNVQEITITKQPDGSFHTSEPNGEENDFPDFQAAMGKAAECLGETVEPDQDDQGSGTDQTGSGGSGTDGMGY